MAPEFEASDGLLMELSVWVTKNQKRGSNVRKVTKSSGFLGGYTTVIEVQGEPIVVYRESFLSKRRLLFGEKVAELLRADGLVLEKDQPSA